MVFVGESKFSTRASFSQKPLALIGARVHTERATEFVA
jgi:hypothetical protein